MFLVRIFDSWQVQSEMSGKDPTEEEERRASTHPAAVFIPRQRLFERQRQAVEICGANARNQSALVCVNGINLDVILNLLFHWREWH